MVTGKQEERAVVWEALKLCSPSPPPLHPRRSRTPPEVGVRLVCVKGRGEGRGVAYRQSIPSSACLPGTEVMNAVTTRVKKVRRRLDGISISVLV